MGRVINPNTAGELRKQLVRGVVVALRELMAQGSLNESTRDLAAFISLSLLEIEDTVELTVSPWEKRGYWLKADRFRRDWEWAGRLGAALRQGVLAEDWEAAAQLAAQIMQKVQGEQVSHRHRLGTPWVGAWVRMMEKPG